MNPEESETMLMEILDAPEGSIFSHGVVVAAVIDPETNKEVSFSITLGAPGFAQVSGLLDEYMRHLYMETYFPHVEMDDD